MSRKAVLAARGILFLFTAAICIFIFVYSSENASESSSRSRPLTEVLLPSVLEKHPDASAGTVIRLKDDTARLVRKTAHSMEYAALGFCAVGFALSFSFEKKNPTLRRFLFFLSGLVFAVGYAVGDEIHQKFVPGRSCEVGDMLLDGVSALVGALIVYGLVFFVANVREKREQQ